MCELGGDPDLDAHFPAAAAAAAGGGGGGGAEAMEEGDGSSSSASSSASASASKMDEAGRASGAPSYWLPLLRRFGEGFTHLCQYVGQHIRPAYVRP